MSKILAVFCGVLACVAANDIRLGDSDGRSTRIFDEIKEASPAIWTRTDEFVVTAAGNNVITAVYVTDLRPDKDGEARIISGGVGEKTVTIGLKSPSVFRGYKFVIEVFAADLNARYFSKGYETNNGQYARKW